MSRPDDPDATATPDDGFERGRPTNTDDGYASRTVERLARRTSPFGRYDIQGELARGGQGAVLRVRDQDLERDLAMKVVLGQLSESPTAVDVGAAASDGEGSSCYGSCLPANEERRTAARQGRGRP